MGRMQPTGRRILVIYNPVAGQRSRGRFKAHLDALRRLGCHIVVRETRARGDAEAFAACADSDACDAVVVAGGDGTINEVVNGLARRTVPLGIIPLGTANVLAAELGLCDGPVETATAIAHAEPHWISTGIANGRRFSMMAGIGFDAHVVANVSPKLKRQVGKLAYVWQTLATCRSFSFPRYRLDIDGVTHEAASAVIANGHFYAGRFVCAPQARLDDNLLHVCLFPTTGAAAALYYATTLTVGQLKTLSDVTVIPATTIDITIVGGDIRDDPVQGDGDSLTYLPAHITSDPASLPVLAGPRAFLSGHSEGARGLRNERNQNHAPSDLTAA